MGDALNYLLLSFLQKEGIHLNQDELKLQLLSHPSYPSLHSVTGVLDHFDIENMALEVPKNRETLFQLPDHFISVINEDKEFVVVTQGEDDILLTHGDKRKETISVNSFLDSWSGIIVVVEKDEVNMPHKKVSDTAFFNGMYILSAVVLLGLFFFIKPTIFQSVHFMLSLIGVAVSFLILKHEFGFQSKALEKFCSATETTNCDAVLNSKGASISNYFKLSDLSFIYFVGLSLSWILTVTFSASNNLIIMVSLLALPITIYSIYYQASIVKKWCPLCLSIVVVLWLQGASLFFNQPLNLNIKPDITGSFILFSSFLFITSLWLFIKPLLKKQQELEKLEIEHYKFKRNFELFDAVYSKGNYLDTSISSTKEIVLGSKNAPLKILLVTNPSCYYCKEAHIDVEKILNKNKDDVNVTIRFNVPSDKNIIGNKVANKLLEIYNDQSIETCKEALHEVYQSDANLDKWLLKWGETTTNSFNNELETQQSWCHTNNINFTPALFINGKQFPKEYNRSDISYFIEDLIEQTEMETPQLNNVEAAN